MSREIKFRAWDTETKEMSYDFLSKNWLKVCIESPYVELMQYSGLKDKNGKEVFEGDILQVEVQMSVDSFFNFTEPVIWNGEFACFDFPNSSVHGINFGALSDKYTKGEVIGNIYEHPHLLEARSAIGTTE